MTPHRRVVRAAPRSPDRPQPVLRFCAVCQVSIAREEIDAGVARPTRAGHLWCGVCVASTAEERARRRAELEAEFADDAPVPVLAPIARKVAGTPLPAAPPPAAARAEPSRPPMTAAEVDVVFLDRRVGELERAAFRLQSRLQTLEERLEQLQRRGGV
jgi:hypothetical protein